MGDGLGDCAGCDLVENHPQGRDLGFQFLQQVPCDGLALAITIGGQQEFIDARQFRLQVFDGGLLVGCHHVERFEVLVHVDACARPFLTLVLGGNVGGPLGEVADVTAAGLHDVAVAKVAGDLGGLRGRLDDHETLECASHATFFR